MYKKILLIALLFTAVSLFARPYVIINEFRYDTPGTDTNCYIELKGTPGASLDSIKVLGINGNGGSEFGLINLSGKVIPADSYFVLAQSAAVPNYDTVSSLLDYQNGPSDNILVVYDSVGIGSRVVLDAVTYGLPSGSDTVFRGEIWPTYDVAPLADGTYYAFMGRHSNADIGNNYFDFAHFMEKTPGYANPAKLDTTIYGIQYATSGISPLNTKTVSIQSAVITAVFSADSGLVFIAQSSGPWNSIVIKGDIGEGNYSVGDSIMLYHGLVFERYGRTEIRSPGTEGISIYSGSIAASKISIAEVDEPYEAVLVKIDSLTAATAPDGNGEWKAVNALGDTLVIDNYATYTVPPTGGMISSITGVIDYTFGVYKLEPRDSNDIVRGYNLYGTVGLADNPADSSGSVLYIVELGVYDTTDASGAYSFGFIENGDYTIIATHTGYLPDTLNATVSASDKQTDFNLAKSTLYDLSGMIGLGDDPADSSGTIVRLDEYAYYDTTDAHGNYQFSSIPAGTYHIIASHTGYVTDTITAVFSGVETFDLTLDLIPTYSLDGIVSLSDAPADSSGTVVFLYELSLYDTTNARGYYLFSGIPAGSYTLISSHDGYKSDTSDVNFVGSLSFNVYLEKLSGIEEEPVKKISDVLSSPSGLSFIYNKETDSRTVIKMYDLTGRTVFTKDVYSGTGVYKVYVDKKLAKGVYFISVEGEAKPYMKKVFLIN